MGENKSATTPKTAAEHAAARRAAKARRRPTHGRGPVAAPLPTKPVFAPAREAELRKVYHRAHEKFIIWGAEMVARNDSCEPRLTDLGHKLGVALLKFYIGFQWEEPGNVGKKIVNKIRELFVEAAYELGVFDMPGQSKIWYEDRAEAVSKAKARENRPKTIAPEPNHTWSPERRQREKAFAEGEVEFRAWAGELVSGSDTSVKRPRLSERTTTSALRHLRFYLGLLDKAPDWTPNQAILTELQSLFRKLCRQHKLSGVRGQNTHWYHQLVRAELNLAG